MTTRDHSSSNPGTPHPGPTDLGSDPDDLMVDPVDHDAVLHALADRLSSVAGLQVVVDRPRSLVSRVVGDLPYANDQHRTGAPMRRMTVTVGPTVYWVEPTSAQPLCAVETVTVDRGRTTNYLELGEWTELLVDDVAHHQHLGPDATTALRSRIRGERAD